MGTAGTSYTGSVLPSGTYFWKVAATNGGGTTWSSVQSFTIPATAASVTLSSPADGATNVSVDPSLSWQAVVDVPVSSYQLQVSSVSNFATTLDAQTIGSGTTSYSATLPSGTYFWKVAATNGGGTTWSSVQSFTIPAATASVTLSSPADGATNVSVDPSLSWQAVVDVPVSSYQVQVSSVSNFATTLDAQTIGSGTTSYSATLPSGAYFWKVGSTNGGGTTWSSVQSFTIPATAASVTLSSPADGATNVSVDPSLSWQAVVDVPVSSYELKISDVSNFATTLDAQTIGSGTTSYSATLPIGTYFWKVAATNGGGTTWSSVQSFTIPAATASVTLSSPADGATNVSVDPSLSWQAVVDVPVSSYELKVSDVSNFATTLDAQTIGSGTTSYSATLPIGTYFWKVAATNGGGTTWSSVQSFTIPAATASVTLSSPADGATNVSVDPSLSWQAVVDVPVSSYQVQVSSVSNFATTIDAQTIGSGTTSYSATLPSGAYFWKVGSTNGGRHHLEFGPELHHPGHCGVRDALQPGRRCDQCVRRSLPLMAGGGRRTRLFLSGTGLFCQ